MRPYWWKSWCHDMQMNVYQDWRWFFLGTGGLTGFEVLLRPKNLCGFVVVLRYNYSSFATGKTCTVPLKLKPKNSGSCQKNNLHHLFLMQVVETWVMLKCWNTIAMYGLENSQEWDTASTAGCLTLSQWIS